jgi:hypothetical protein
VSAAIGTDSFSGNTHGLQISGLWLNAYVANDFAPFLDLGLGMPL